MKSYSALIAVSFSLCACSDKPVDAVAGIQQPVAGSWENDFFDDFETFDADNWQGQILWVNSEDQCYVRDNESIMGSELFFGFSNITAQLWLLEK